MAKHSRKAVSAAVATAVEAETRGTREGWMNDAKHGVLIGAAALEAELSPAQTLLVEEFCWSALGRAQAIDAFDAADDALFSQIFPALPSFDVWTPVVRAIRTECGDYPAKCFRASCKRVFGALPVAGAGTGEGTKGLSAKKSARGIHSTMEKLAEQIAKIPAKDVNASVLTGLADALAALKAAEARLAAAVNE